MRTILVIMLLAAASGCSSSSTTEKFCDRADSCDILATNVNECVRILDDALDELPDSVREEAENQLEDCLDRASCSGFASCLSSFRTREDAASSLMRGPLASE
jgi:hypothetical protein